MGWDRARDRERESGRIREALCRFLARGLGRRGLVLESDHASRMVLLGAWASAFFRVGVAPFLPSPGEETLEERLLHMCRYKSLELLKKVKLP